MLNAFQQRMVEESLVEKEVYESMMSLRKSIGDAVGTPVRGQVEKNLPDLHDLPGDRGSGPRPSTVRYGTDMGNVPPEVAAAGDPLRDQHDRVIPFTPATVPQGGADPFPMLGPKGRPLA
jgi:hypothetical protein